MDPITLGIILPALIGGGYFASRAIAGMTKARFLELIGPRTLYLEGKVAQAETGMTANISREPGESADHARARVVTPLVRNMISAKHRLIEVTSKFQSLRSSFTPAELSRAEAAMPRARTVMTREEATEARWLANRASLYDRANIPWTYQVDRTIGASVKESSRQAAGLTEAARRRIDPASDDAGQGDPEPAPPEDDGLNTTLLIVGAASVLILGGGLAFGLISRKRRVGVKNPGAQLRRKLRAHRRALCSMR